MRHIEVHARVQGHTAAEAYKVICDFERYPEHTEAVRSVSIEQAGNNMLISSWEVNFRKGILRWVEEDHFNPHDHTVQFHQVGGDIDYFAGEWVVSEAEDGCRIEFVANFDMGIPGLADVIEPLAEQALVDNIRSIISGLLPGSVEFLSTDSEEVDTDTRPKPC